MLPLLLTISAWVCFIYPVLLYSLEPASLLINKQQGEPTLLQRRERRLQTLIHEQQNYRQAIEEIRHTIEDTSNQMHALKKVMTEKPVPFLTKKLSLISQQHTLFIEWEELIQKINRTIDAIISSLRDQNSNTSARDIQTADTIKTKALCSFEDVMNSERQVVSMHDQLIELESMRALLAEDINQRKKIAAVAIEEYNNKQLAQQQFTSTTHRATTIDGISHVQQGEIIDLEERLAFHKKEFLATRLQEAEYSLENTETTINKLKIEFVNAKQHAYIIKKRAHISVEYLEKAERDLNNKRQNAVSLRENINEKIRVVTEQENKTQQKIRDAQRQFDITANDLVAIKNLTKEPKNVVDWKTYARLLALCIDESLFKIEHEIYTAQLEVNKAQVKRYEIDTMIISSWHRMTNKESQFLNDDDIEQEIKTYVTHKTDLDSQLSTLTRAREGAIKSFHEFNVSFDKLRVIAEDLSRNQHTLFKEYIPEFYAIHHMFESIEEKVARRFDWVSQLIETYSTAIAQTQESIKKLENITQELSTKSFWRRSELSLSWTDVTNFIPEMHHFFVDLWISLAQCFSYNTIVLLYKKALGILTDPLRLALIVVNGILMITCYFLLKLYLPDIVSIIGSIGQGYWIIHGISVICATFLSFILQHLQSVYIWSITCMLIQTQIISSILFAQLFYLATIPYALWLISEMIHHWRTINHDRRYMFISESYEKRFFTIIAFMLGVIAIVSCIRQAFILGRYTHSHVPVILLALLFILGQISMIGLVSRTQIVGMIQGETPLLQWIYDHVNRYYYILWVALIGIIVMSNPYVGYGRQVFYIIVRLLFTSLLIPLCSWIHGTLKQVSLDLFFYYADRETLKERFITGKFWYSMTVISSLAVLLVAGIYCGAKLWGMPLTIRDMLSWLKYPLYTQLDEAGRTVQVTALSLIHILLYALGGLISAYCINTFVLSRVLDPIIVESGVQNTILTLMRYVVITIALFMGLTSAGLGGLTTKLAILFAGISFAVQDVVKDFLSYFVLLVQRPIKVGDFIRVLDPLSGDENVSLMGFVRSITPRSIVVRKRNSTTVIIPNSRVVTNPVMNWSYTRGFFAFDDMRLTVPFGVDPSLVRQLMLDVLDKNPHVLKNPAPIVRLDDFNESGYSFLLRGFLTSNKIGEQWDIASDIRLHVVKILRENQIEIASPRRFIKIIPATETAEQLRFEDTAEEAYTKHDGS